MKKLIMWKIITLDGYFEGEQKWDCPFTKQLGDKNFRSFTLNN